MKTECNYPDCKCPFDMGKAEKCLIGLPSKETEKQKTRSQALEHAHDNQVKQNGYGY